MSEALTNPCISFMVILLYVIGVTESVIYGSQFGSNDIKLLVFSPDDGRPAIFTLTNIKCVTVPVSFRQSPTGISFTFRWSTIDRVNFIGELNSLDVIARMVRPDGLKKLVLDPQMPLLDMGAGYWAGGRRLADVDAELLYNHIKCEE
ncbi:hypothetical protein FOL47_005987 [Perkinsus chesapeaki]|uniref:Uncharacterized protein n=1 Tax=Perkinsus chesapeaki TaxID=330153 RepID=A0A7J6LUX4_PERCH|nr:hypothetical protein FOL47_005987 [Perkinsus chesapeaki]